MAVTVDFQPGSADERIPGTDVAAEVLQARLRERRRNTIVSFLGQLGVLAVAIGAWQLISGSLASVNTVSSPVKVWNLAISWLHTGVLLPNTGITLEETLIGFAIGVVCGAVSGILLGSAMLASRVLSPYVNALYALPKIALGPLFIVWFGISLELKIVLAALFVYFLVLYNTWTGIREVDEDLVNVLRLMGAGRLEIIRKALLPSALVWLVVGLRISFPNALIGAIIGELLASNQGLGYLINKSAALYSVTGVFVPIIVLIIIAAVFDRLVVVVQHLFELRFGKVS